MGCLLVRQPIFDTVLNCVEKRLEVTAAWAATSFLYEAITRPQDGVFVRKFVQLKNLYRLRR